MSLLCQLSHWEIPTKSFTNSSKQQTSKGDVETWWTRIKDDNNEKILNITGAKDQGRPSNRYIEAKLQPERFPVAYSARRATSLYKKTYVSSHHEWSKQNLHLPNVLLTTHCDWLGASDVDRWSNLRTIWYSSEEEEQCAIRCFNHWVQIVWGSMSSQDDDGMNWDVRHTSRIE